MLDGLASREIRLTPGLTDHDLGTDTNVPQRQAGLFRAFSHGSFFCIFGTSSVALCLVHTILAGCPSLSQFPRLGKYASNIWFQYDIFLIAFY